MSIDWMIGMNLENKTLRLRQETEARLGAG